MDKSKQPWWRGQRGEWYVIAQFALFLFIVLGPRTVAGLPPWPAGLISFSSIAGTVLLALGGFVSLLAVLHLGSNLTPLPHPKEGATLVETGMYRFVRHPIYFGVILMTFGFALSVQGWLTLFEALALARLLRHQVAARGSLAGRALSEYTGLPAACSEADSLHLLIPGSCASGSDPRCIVIVHFTGGGRYEEIAAHRTNFRIRFCRCRPSCLRLRSQGCQQGRQASGRRGQVFFHQEV